MSHQESGPLHPLPLSRSGLAREGPALERRRERALPCSLFLPLLLSLPPSLTALADYCQILWFSHSHSSTLSLSLGSARARTSLVAICRAESCMSKGLPMREAPTIVSMNRRKSREQRNNRDPSSLSFSLMNHLSVSRSETDRQHLKRGPPHQEEVVLRGLT